MKNSAPIKSKRLKVNKIAAYMTTNGELFLRRRDAVPAQNAYKSEASRARAEKRLVKHAKQNGISGRKFIDFMAFYRRDVLLALAA